MIVPDIISGTSYYKTVAKRIFVNAGHALVAHMSNGNITTFEYSHFIRQVSLYDDT